MFKAVLFDYGGTLVAGTDGDMMPLVMEGAKLAHKYLEETLDAVPPFPAFVTAATQTLQSAFMRTMALPQELDGAQAIADVLKALGIALTNEQFDKFARAWYTPFSARIALKDGAKDCLDAIKAAGAKLAIVSNNIWPQRFLEEELQRLGIADRFDYVIASSKHGVKKPHAPIFEDTLKALGVGEDEAAFVGDSLREDVVGPSMVGMRTVYVGVNSDAMPGVTPDATIKSLAELPAVLEGMGD